MDPWYYNRFSNASASFQSGSTPNAGDYHQQLAGHQPATGSGASSASQLLLQAAHNSSLTPSPFNPGGFLTSPPVGYDPAVFSPLFSHSHGKSSPYSVSQHRALAMASSKTSAESGNFSPAHHQSSASSSGPFFDHQNSAASSIAWSHQASSQLPSPFGVLPHESVSASSATSSTSKASGMSDYPFNSYSVPHNLNHLSQLAEFKNSSSYADSKKGVRSHSPSNTAKASSSSVHSSFFPASSEVNPASNYSRTDSSSVAGYSSSSKFSNNPVQPQQSCIVSSASGSSSSLSKDYQQQQSSSRTSNSSVYQSSHVSSEKQSSSRSSSFVPPIIKSSSAPNPVQTKAQSKSYASDCSSEQSRQSESLMETNQSSPISLSMMESHRYGITATAAKQLNQRLGNSQQSYQSTVNPQAAYRHYVNSGGSGEAEYLRSKSSSVESGYSTSSQHNGSECVPASRRASPQTSHSQPSPVGHVQSPAYPMYNSPMASLPSPSSLQHSDSANNQCQTVSNSYKPNVPQDSPASRPQNVAYPSVITRALTPSNVVAKSPVYNDTRPYDRSQEQNHYSKPCWESERPSSVSQQQNSTSHETKYPSNNSTYNASTSDMTGSVSQPHQVSRVSNSTIDRQHPYYDGASGHQVSSQDPSGCRGDPMNVVKNLQHMQQVCSVQPSQNEARSDRKMPSIEYNKASSNSGSSSSSKRRKNSEKQAASNPDYFNSRVPPPAHVNMGSQHQQNGSYFPGYLSPPSTSKSYTGAQNPLHHASNPYSGNQHQGLYPSPYFTPFPLAGTSSNNAPDSSTHVSQSSAVAAYESTNVNSEGQHPESQQQSSSSNLSQSQVQEAPAVATPKVIVPNIEEELSFLADAEPVIMTKSEQGGKSTTSSGFEASYLKFLQGERETSPPPSNRGGRKGTWPKVKSLQPESPKTAVTCSTTSNGTSSTTSTAAKEKTPTLDPEDDPRYFPLPKTDAQRQSLDTSDSDSDNEGTKSKPSKNQNCKAQGRKPVAAVAPRTSGKSSHHKSPSKGTPGPPAKRGRKRKPEAPVPRRETSKRKAKEKGSILLDDGEDDPDQFGDSDSDPAWTPVASKAKPPLNNDSSEEDVGKKKAHKRTSKLSGPGRKRSKHVFSDDDASSDGEAKSNKRTVGPRRKKISGLSAGVNSSSVKSEDDTAADAWENEVFPYKVGDFVVIKTDLSEKWPPIWRVDGKTLLQKFEPVELKGKMLYRNISTYSGWSPQNRHIYGPVQVKIKAHTRAEIIVEFLRDEMVQGDSDMLEKLIKDTAKYQDNFEVYIQTLISQALDSNFLTEIFQEKDEYFLSNVKTVDDIVDDRRQRFLRIVKWQKEFEASIATWPCYNLIFELVGDEVLKNCAACDKQKVVARVQLYGQPYNSTTLEGCQPDPNLVSLKDFLTCRLCLTQIEQYNKVAHQKYLMFIECAKRVNERRAADSSKDTTVILNELLADEKWLNELFRSVRTSWAEIDCLEQSAMKKNKTPSD